MSLYDVIFCLDNYGILMPSDINKIQNILNKYLLKKNSGLVTAFNMYNRLNLIKNITESYSPVGQIITDVYRSNNYRITNAVNHPIINNITNLNYVRSDGTFMSFSLHINNIFKPINNATSLG
jgi:hypothetical protein